MKKHHLSAIKLKTVKMNSSKYGTGAVRRGGPLEQTAQELNASLPQQMQNLKLEPIANRRSGAQTEMKHHTFSSPHDANSGHHNAMLESISRNEHTQTQNTKDMSLLAQE